MVGLALEPDYDAGSEQLEQKKGSNAQLDPIPGQEPGSRCLSTCKGSATYCQINIQGFLKGFTYCKECT